MTDLPGDDQAEFTGSSIRVRLGTGATATTGGRLDAAGRTATLTLTLTNPNAMTEPLGARLTDQYPAGMVNASPPRHHDLHGGSVTAVPGASTLRLAGGPIPRGGSCTVQGSCIRPSNSQVLDASKILCMRASSRALNSASDCWAVSPSTSAREKLATMP